MWKLYQMHGLCNLRWKTTDLGLNLSWVLHSSWIELSHKSGLPLSWNHLTCPYMTCYMKWGPANVNPLLDQVCPWRGIEMSMTCATKTRPICQWSSIFWAKSQISSSKGYILHSLIINRIHSKYTYIIFQCKVLNNCTINIMTTSIANGSS